VPVADPAVFIFGTKTEEKYEEERVTLSRMLQGIKGENLTS